LSLFTRLLLAGYPVDVFEDGQITRDFVFLSDVVDALVLAGSAAPITEDPINIGTGIGTTIIEAALQLARAVGRPDDAIRVTGAFRAGDIRHAIADVRRAELKEESVLGWRPRVDFAAGAAALVTWARQHAGEA
jgi:dTDP-L-rhamnose 4-epimerase